MGKLIKYCIAYGDEVKSGNSSSRVMEIFEADSTLSKRKQGSFYLFQMVEVGSLLQY